MAIKFENLQKLSDTQFRRLTPVKRLTFSTMVEIIRQADKAKKVIGGRPNKLGVEERILMTLEYLREYRTYAHIALSYGLSESATFQTIRFIENVLVKSKEFRLPGKKALLKSDHEFEVILIDAVESPIERPKKKQRRFYSGKKKRHTVKSQVVVDKLTAKIICTAYSNGKKHDFRLLKESKVFFHPTITVATDTGYQGLQKIHERTLMPKKKSKKHPLSSEEKSHNREISSQRVLNEHVIGKIKRFSLRFNLIAGIYNSEL